MTYKLENIYIFMTKSLILNDLELLGLTWNSSCFPLTKAENVALKNSIKTSNISFICIDPIKLGLSVVITLLLPHCFMQRQDRDENQSDSTISAIPQSYNCYNSQTNAFLTFMK
jgi:hypothetical protein